MKQTNRAACWIIDHAGHVLPFTGHRGDVATIRYHTFEGSTRWHAGPPGNGKTGHKSPVTRSCDRTMNLTALPSAIA